MAGGNEQAWMSVFHYASPREVPTLRPSVWGPFRRPPESHSLGAAAKAQLCRAAWVNLVETLVACGHNIWKYVRQDCDALCSLQIN
jgi:hypothetical protein